VRDPEEVFYNDCPPHIAAWASARLEHQSLISWRQPLRPAAWRGIPSTYIVCTKDAAMPPSLQERMAGRAGEMLFLDSSHPRSCRSPTQWRTSCASRCNGPQPRQEISGERR